MTLAKRPGAKTLSALYGKNHIGDEFDGGLKALTL
jgi:hypothetical protein